jgi:hypothetical protein
MYNEHSVCVSAREHSVRIMPASDVAAGMKVAELKAALKQRGLPATGLKAGSYTRPLSAQMSRV